MENFYRESVQYIPFFIASLSFDEETFLDVSPRKIAEEGTDMQLFSPKQVGKFERVSYVFNVMLISESLQMVTPF